MAQAWKILLVLTFARISMGFQFQSIPALAGPLAEEQGLGLVAVGSLTGAYLLPGAIVALAGGWLGQRLGAARIAFIGLMLMTVGGFAGWWVTGFEAALAWRMIAGVGAVGLNVMLTKMAADWFEGRDDLATGMGVLVSSWPAGIALAALGLPLAAASWGLPAALLVAPLFCAAGWGALWLIWKEPAVAAASARPVATKTGFAGHEVVLVFLAGSIWATYNVALVGVIGWTPALLAEAGIAPLGAAAAASLIGWTAIFSVALGGWLSSRLRSRNLLPLAFFASSAASIALLPALGPAAGGLAVMAWIGLVIGPAAALVMTLPVEAARPHLRALVMGIYFAIYYAAMGIAPVLLGALSEISGSVSAPLLALAALLLYCMLAWGAFRAVQSRQGAQER